jgi:hypothetical protein
VAGLYVKSGARDGNYLCSRFDPFITFQFSQNNARTGNNTTDMGLKYGVWR